MHYFRFETGIVSVQENLEEGAFMSIFPNPVNDHLNIRIHGMEGKNQLMIYDPTGKLVAQMDRVFFQKEDKYQWRHALASGMYSLVVKNDNKIVTEHFIVP